MNSSSTNYDYTIFYNCREDFCFLETTSYEIFLRHLEFRSTNQSFAAKKSVKYLSKGM